MYWFDWVIRRRCPVLDGVLVLDGVQEVVQLFASYHGIFLGCLLHYEVYC